MSKTVNTIAMATLGLCSALTAFAASDFAYVKIPTSNCIQTSLISTFPTGAFHANNRLQTPFEIQDQPGDCGYTGTGSCNFYDAFGFSGSGQTITMNVMIPKPALVFTLMNAYAPPIGQQIATIEFIGSSGAIETFPLVPGRDIRDFYDGEFADSLENGIPHVRASNAFSCVDPTTCLGAGGTGDVNTGDTGAYRVDEQEYDLSAGFATQDLVQIVITDTYDGAVPILLGVTVMPENNSPPRIAGFAPTSGVVGVTVTIEGSAMVGAIAVTFNGVPASFTVESWRQLTATVPAGAATGPIQVTTPHGTATSLTNFTVN